MAIKTPKTTHLSEPLAGEDAERLVDYLEQPSPPTGHTEFLAASDAAVEETYSATPANESF